jgi:MFS family permease
MDDDENVRAREMQEGRSAYGVFALVFVAGIVLAWGSSFDGPAVRISRDYWRWAALAAIPLGIIIAWRLHKALFGAWYKPRYAKEERQIGLPESWVMGVIAAVILVGFAMGAFANVMNQVIGLPYVATYIVAAKYVEHGKRTCYGLTLAKVGDWRDRFQMCVPEMQQKGTALGEILHVSGRRSRYVNQVLAYTGDR